VAEDGICMLGGGAEEGVCVAEEGVCAFGVEEVVWALPRPIPAIPRASTEAVARTNFFIADLH